MQQMYKVFIYNKVLILTSNIDGVRYLGSISSVYDNQKNFGLWFDKFVKSPEKQALVFAFNPDDVLKYLKKDKAKCIKAAGGIIKNNDGDVLLIKRRGKWDMPKGKMDPGESHAETALREVEEECGIRCEILPGSAYVTYHTYQEKGKSILKETFWYPMLCKDPTGMTPQAEEDITDIGFYSDADTEQKLENSFGNITVLWEQFKVDRAH
jgi:8-oxo-dGTP pyrophosphatase MutT (NUDIX family)